MVLVVRFYCLVDGWFVGCGFGVFGGFAVLFVFGLLAAGLFGFWVLVFYVVFIGLLFACLDCWVCYDVVPCDWCRLIVFWWVG